VDDLLVEKRFVYTLPPEGGEEPATTVVEGGQPLEGGPGTGPAGGGNREGEGSKSSQSFSVKEKSSRSSSKRSPAKTSSSEPSSTETPSMEAGPGAASGIGSSTLELTALARGGKEEDESAFTARTMDLSGVEACRVAFPRVVVAIAFRLCFAI